MGGYQITTNIYNALIDEISKTNQLLVNSLKAKSTVINSVEFVKISLSENLLEDVEFLNTLSGNSLFKIRHANIIMRDMLEQVIEFIYLIKHPEIISEYFGSNIDTDKLLKHKPIKGIHKLGNERYTDSRKSVSEMARDINEKNTTPNRPALYDMYQLLSEECHNSYFFSNFDDIEELEHGEEILALSEEQAQNIVIILDRFMETYRK